MEIPLIKTFITTNYTYIGIRNMTIANCINVLQILLSLQSGEKSDTSADTLIIDDGAASGNSAATNVQCDVGAGETVPNNMATAISVANDSTTAVAPVANGSTTAAALVANDSTTAAALVANDSTTAAAPVANDNTTAAAPVANDSTTAVAPVSDDATALAAEVSRPVEVQDTGSDEPPARDAATDGPADDVHPDDMIHDIQQDIQMLSQQTTDSAYVSARAGINVLTYVRAYLE